MLPFWGFLASLGVGAGVISLLVIAGIIWGIGTSAGWWGKNHAKRLQAPERRPYAYLDAGKPLSEQEVRKVIAAYERDEVVGAHALTCRNQLDRAKQTSSAITQVLDAEFERNSLTWDRFSVPVENASTAIVANAAQIANHLQSFDAREYDHLDRMERAGALEGKDADRKRLELCRQSFREMEALEDSSERLLVELEHLRSELQMMSGSDLGDRASSIADEIERLADETHYYA